MFSNANGEVPDSIFVPVMIQYKLFVFIFSVTLVMVSRLDEVSENERDEILYLIRYIYYWSNLYC